MNAFETVDYVRGIYPLAYCKETFSYGKRGFVIMDGETMVDGKDAFLTGWSYTTREQAWAEAVRYIHLNMLRKLES